MACGPLLSDALGSVPRSKADEHGGWEAETVSGTESVINPDNWAVVEALDPSEWAYTNEAQSVERLYLVDRPENCDFDPSRPMTPLTAAPTPTTTDSRTPIGSALPTTPAPGDPSSSIPLAVAAAFETLYGRPISQPFYERFVEACERGRTASDEVLFELLIENGTAMAEKEREMSETVCPDVYQRLVGLAPIRPASEGVVSSSSATTLTDVGEPAAILAVIDGDTVDVSIGRIRIIGYDTPEEGQPCYQEAKDELQSLVDSGLTTVLAEPGHDDVDDYGRLLRHLYVDGVPVGQELIRAGLADARYDSRDGYDPHRHERLYRTLDARYANSCDTSMTSTTSPTTLAPIVPPPPPREDGGGSPSRDDNPYDDGGPRNPDGSCRPGGCWPGT